MLYNPSTKTAKLYDFCSSITMIHTFTSYVQSQLDGTPGFIPHTPTSRSADTRLDVYSMGTFPYYFLCCCVLCVLCGVVCVVFFFLIRKFRIANFYFQEFLCIICY
jgi:serine/threonine protein kinase